MTLDRKKLDEILKKEGFQAYKRELSQPWPTMHFDMGLAFTVMTEYLKKTSQGLRMLEYLETDGEETVTLPEWQRDIHDRLIKSYGESTGYVIFEKVMHQIINMMRHSEKQ